MRKSERRSPLPVHGTVEWTRRSVLRHSTTNAVSHQLEQGAVGEVGAQEDAVAGLALDASHVAVDLRPPGRLAPRHVPRPERRLLVRPDESARPVRARDAGLPQRHGSAGDVGRAAAGCAYEAALARSDGLELVCAAGFVRGFGRVAQREQLHLHMQLM